MRHLVIIIYPTYVGYRMGGQMGSHPCRPDERQSAIDYLISMIQPVSVEILNHEE